MASKRCICGLSKGFPICDGSHRSKRWSCQAEAGTRAELCFLTGPHHQNLAERLAAELGGVAAHTHDGRLLAQRLVVITDGTDLDAVMAAVERVDAPIRCAIVLNLAPALLGGVFPQWPVERVDAEGLQLWSAVRAAVGTLAQGRRDDAPARVALAPAFISHAVADEHLIQAPLDYLRRRYQADLFLCADSITSGEVWHDQIIDQLRSRPRFIMLLSAAASASTFCAFEVGYALASGKRAALISLDGSHPPPYIQHLHMLDVPRRRAVAPWLTQQEAIVDALLEVLAHGPGALEPREPARNRRR